MVNADWLKAGPIVNLVLVIPGCREGVVSVKCRACPGELACRKSDDLFCAVCLSQPCGLWGSLLYSAKKDKGS